MHELSLAGNVLQIVEQAALREGFAQVAVLRLEAGALAGVEEHALRFALASLSPGTCLEGARIDIETPPGRARCTACGTDSQIDARTDPCPACGAWGLVPTGGLGLRVLELLVRDAHSSAPNPDHPTHHRVGEHLVAAVDEPQLE